MTWWWLLTRWMQKKYLQEGQHLEIHRWRCQLDHQRHVVWCFRSSRKYTPTNTPWNGKTPPLYGRAMMEVCIKPLNGGTTWSHKGSGIVNSQMYKLGLSQADGKVMTGLQDNGSKLKQTAGSWSDVLGGDGMECAVNKTTDRYCMARCTTAIYNRSINGGSSW